jgi:hypothetical protein
LASIRILPVSVRPKMAAQWLFVEKGKQNNWDEFDLQKKDESKPGESTYREVKPPPSVRFTSAPRSTKILTTLL